MNLPAFQEPTGLVVVVSVGDHSEALTACSNANRLIRDVYVIFRNEPVLGILPDVRIEFS